MRSHHLAAVTGAAIEAVTAADRHGAVGLLVAVHRGGAAIVEAGGVAIAVDSTHRV